MFSGSITVLIVLVAFFSPGTVSGQNSTAITPNSTVTHNVTESTSSQSSQAITPSSVSSAPLPSASVSANTIETTTTTTTKQTTTPATEPATERTPEPTGSTTTPHEKLRTCANLSVIVEMDWNEMFTNKSSQLYQNYTKLLNTSLRNLYTNSSDVELTKVTFTEEVKQVLTNAILHLFVISENEYIEDMFIKKVKSGKLSEDLPSVKKDSATFEPIGVSFTEWKAKDGECEKICEGAGGPFDIERKCQAKRYSCKGHKKSDKSKECVKYCPPESSNAAITVPSFILAIGIFLSFSFQ